MEKGNNGKRPYFKVCQNIIAPGHRLEIDLVGAGGTGSQVLQGLARMNLALESLGHPGLHVTVFDFDKVEEPNIGRQLFSHHDIGQNKAGCLVSKINRFYGYSWAFEPRKYGKTVRQERYDMVISCVDNVKARRDISKIFDRTMSYGQNHYWMDFGNGANQGQVIMGSSVWEKGYRLSTVADVGIPKKDDPEVPSCSLAEALEKQDLMINPMIANAGLAMLWKMFRTLKVEYNAVFLNLEKMQMKPNLIYTKTK